MNALCEPELMTSKTFNEQTSTKNNARLPALVSTRRTRVIKTSLSTGRQSDTHFATGAFVSFEERVCGRVCPADRLRPQTFLPSPTLP